jgi:hypothetical protein
MDIIYAILLTPMLDSGLQFLHVSKGLEIRRVLALLLDGELEPLHLF